jgi:hypothetical protein
MVPGFSCEDEPGAHFTLEKVRSSGRHSAAKALVRGEQSVQFGSKLRLVPAGFVEIGRALRRGGQCNGFEKD